MPHDRRPAERYYESRTELFSQGDLFAEVPLAYPAPANSIVLDEDDTARRFLSGPLDVGLAVLVTPTCSMRSQSEPSSQYAHPVRCLVPLRPVDELLDAGVLDDQKLGLAQSRDSLINYMYFPADVDLGIPESLALLYMPVTLHHDMLAGSRLTQLTRIGAQQLQRKLVWHSSSVLLRTDDFEPPLD